MIVNGIEVPEEAIRIVEEGIANIGTIGTKLSTVRRDVENTMGHMSMAYSDRLCDRLFQKSRRAGEIIHIGGGLWVSARQE